MNKQVISAARQNGKSTIHKAHLLSMNRLRRELGVFIRGQLQDPNSLYWNPK